MTALTKRSTAMLAMAFAAWSCAAVSSTSVAAQQPATEVLETAAQFQGEAAEQYLARARVREMRDIGVGVTLPQRATLELDGVQRRAIFKTIDVIKPGITQLSGGSSEMNFQDSWQCEVPAYVIDRIIGLQMVPATIERSINGQRGSLQWWVQSIMAEADRQKKGIEAPDSEEFNRRLYKMHLFDQLIANVDRHMNNILITKDFDLRLIDHSRAFRRSTELKDTSKLTRFSRSLLEGIGRLEYQDLRKKTSRWLDDAQVRGVLARRDAIVALARKLVAEKGEAAVIYP
jgi:hypothetical protein